MGMLGDTERGSNQTSLNSQSDVLPTKKANRRLGSLAAMLV